jgi:acetyl esterase/lipase
MRRSRLPARLLMTAVAALAFAAAGVSTALADTNTSTSDGGLSLTASLSPDTVSGKQQVTQSETVKNDGKTTKSVTVRVFGPRQQSSAPPQAVVVTLVPGASFSQSVTFPASTLSRGTHSLTVIAVDRANKDSALASASITVN